MHDSRLILVGGFLGAGKTTALLQLARRFIEAGLGTGLITNDQAADLVDTGNLRRRGLNVEEVAGGCFCCRFDDLTQAAARLRSADRPQVILGEPVGSCTDIVATVISPMKRIHGDPFIMAPYSVLVDPVRAAQMFLNRSMGGFSSNVAYIFQKQLEEADVIVLNKIDLLEGSRAEAICAAMREEFPDTRIIRVSAETGAGFDDWIDLLTGGGTSGARILDLDYDTYAAGEAELGWLNATASVEGPHPFCGDDLVMDLLSGVGGTLAAAGLEPAHLKVLFTDAVDPGAAVASLVRSGDVGTLSRSIARPSRSGTLTVNARVHADPAALRQHVEMVLGEVASRHGVSIRFDRVASFRPPRPVPVHRDTRPNL